jgi:hypothetical protein
VQPVEISGFSHFFGFNPRTPVGHDGVNWGNIAGNRINGTRAW